MKDYEKQSGEMPNNGERRINGHLMCMAKDCPLRASVNLGGGWLCSCHAFVSADRWPSITSKLRSKAASDARLAIAALRKIIDQNQTNDIPVFMRQAQNALLSLGAIVEELKRRTLTDIHGEEFPEPPEAFANRLDRCLTRLIAPVESAGKAQQGSDKDRVQQNKDLLHKAASSAQYWNEPDCEEAPL